MSSLLQTCNCLLVNNQWMLDGDPLIMHRAVTIFNGRAKRGEGKIWIPANPESCRDLMWFRQRYPLNVNPEKHMRMLAAQHLSAVELAEQILSPEYVASEVKLADGEEARPHQLVAADLWDAVGGLLLADGLGVGKTISAIAGLTKPDKLPAVIVLPPTLSTQWVRQLRRFVPTIKTHVLSKTEPYDLRVLYHCPGCRRWIDSEYQKRCPNCRYRVPSSPNDRSMADVYICSYNKLHGWPEMLGQTCKSVIFEEGHHLRRTGTDKYNAARQLAHMVENRLALTATPIYNLGGEAFNVVECVRPGFLGPKDQFKIAWCNGIGSEGKEPPLTDPEAFGQYLRASGVMLRRTAKDVGVKLGECVRIVQPVDASLTVFEKSTDRAGELARKLLSPERLERGRAMQIAGEFDTMMRRATGLAKIPFVNAFVQMILEQSIPVVLFAWHHAVYDYLRSPAANLGEYNPVFYTGNESTAEKDAAIEKFVTEKSDLFVMSLASGEGVDGLQYRASTCVFAEIPWVPAQIDQCVGRLDRDGQKDPVTAYICLSEFGMDPIMSEVLDIKSAEFRSLVGESAIGPQRKVDSAECIRRMAQQFLASMKR